MILKSGLVVVLGIVVVYLNHSQPPGEKGGAFVVEPPDGVPGKKTPLLFVHGVAHGGWIFKGIAQQLAAEGWTSHCITLSKDRFKTLSMFMREIHDYIKENMDAAPVLAGSDLICPALMVGHSMGSMLVQHFMLNENENLPASLRAKGVVLIAGCGSHDVGSNLRSLVGFTKKNFLGCLWGTIVTNGRHFIGMSDDVTKRFMFGPNTKTTTVSGEGEEGLDMYLKRLSAVESGVVGLDMIYTVATVPHRTSPKDLNIPALSVIPELDGIIPLQNQQEMAEFWGSEVVNVEGQGHCLGDAGWETAYAPKFLSWMTKHFE